MGELNKEKVKALMKERLFSIMEQMICQYEDVEHKVVGVIEEFGTVCLLLEAYEDLFKEPMDLPSEYEDRLNELMDEVSEFLTNAFNVED